MNLIFGNSWYVTAPVVSERPKIEVIGIFKDAKYSEVSFFSGAAP